MSSEGTPEELIEKGLAALGVAEFDDAIERFGSAAVEAPLPAVKVTNIGMHIGGGPNDAPTKEPIRRAVEPHFDAFRRCFALVDEAKKGDFGVDLLIDREGGKAKISHPRTAATISPP